MRPKRRLAKVCAAIVLVLVAVCASSVGVFDRLVVAPAVVNCEAFIASAAGSERDLTPAMLQVLGKQPGRHLTYLVARDILQAPPSQIESVRTADRQLMELGVGLLLPLHLSQRDLTTVYATRLMMGRGVRGLAQAAKVHTGVPLEQVTVAQAARLVVISRSPPYYLDNPELLDERVHRLLSTQAE